MTRQAPRRTAESNRGSSTTPTPAPSSTGPTPGANSRRARDEARGVNIADLALDRHVRAGRGDQVALRWIGRDPSDVDDPVDLTYAGLATRTDRFACALRRNGFGPGTGVASLTGRIPGPLRERIGRAQGAVRLHADVLGIRPRPDRATAPPRPDPDPRDDPDAVPAQGRRHRRPTARPRTRADLRCDRGPDRRLDHGGGRTARVVDGVVSLRRHRHVRHRLHRPRNARAPALHQRHDRHTERRGARARCRGHPPPHRPARARSPPRRRLLVHGRPGLGHRHVLRDHRAADQRRDEHHRRGRLRRRTLVPHPRTARRRRVLHRPDGDPDAAASRARTGRDARLRRRCGSSPASASHSMPRPCDGARRSSVSRSSTPGGRRRRAAS